MREQDDQLTEFHWMLDMVQHVDVGIVVLNKKLEVKIWNGFMESHSSLLPSQVRDKSILELYPHLDPEWFRRKVKPVFELRTRAFMTWEQRPYLFQFPNYRPITGSEDFMYQNVTLSPLADAVGKVEYLCMMIYDVTDVAVSKKQLEALQVAESERQERKQTS